MVEEADPGLKDRYASLKEEFELNFKLLTTRGEAIKEHDRYKQL